MTDDSLTVRRIADTETDRVESLLAANDLPNRDVREKPACFFLAYAGPELVGTGGIEQYGPNGLLRSVVVAESHRGSGYGTALCDALEAHARSDGVRTLYLLTTTAAPFFRRRGYESVARDAVPERIRATAEFTDLCPASATCMAKSIER